VNPARSSQERVRCSLDRDTPERRWVIGSSRIVKEFGKDTRKLETTARQSRYDQ